MRELGQLTPTWVSVILLWQLLQRCNLGLLSIRIPMAKRKIRKQTIQATPHMTRRQGNRFIPIVQYAFTYYRPFNLPC